MVCGKNPRRLFGSFTPKVDGQGGTGIRIRHDGCLDHVAGSAIRWTLNLGHIHLTKNFTKQCSSVLMFGMFLSCMYGEIGVFACWCQ